MTTKYSNDSALDAALNWIKTNGVKMYVTTASIDSTSVVSYTKITTTAALTGAIAVSWSAVSIANGSTSGRKIAVPAQSSQAVTATGTAARVCLVNSAGSGTVAYVTTCTSQALTSGNTVSIPAWNIELRDPS